MFDTRCFHSCHCIKEKQGYFGHPREPEPRSTEGAGHVPGSLLPWDSQGVELVPYQGRIYYSGGDGEAVPFPQAATDTQNLSPSQVLGVQQQLLPRHSGRRGTLLSWTLVLAAPKEHQFWFSAETPTFLHPPQPSSASSSTRSSSILPGAHGMAPGQPGEEAAAPAGNPCPQPYTRAHIQELWELPGCSPRFTPTPARTHAATALRARLLVTHRSPHWHRSSRAGCFPQHRYQGQLLTAWALARSILQPLRGSWDRDRGLCATLRVRVPPWGSVCHPRGRVPPALWLSTNLGFAEGATEAAVTWRQRAGPCCSAL